MAAGPYSDTVMDHFTNPRNKLLAVEQLLRQAP